ncbi:MAG: hypothetical protein K8T20_19800 [Planctomycetes bacterium]|nr:hypothetical protein [Planctomycetota bacterium]
MKRLGRIAVLLPFLVAGCSHEITIEHDEPHVVSESEARIEANVTALDQGAVRITAFRVSEKRIEQEFWRRKQSRGPGVPMVPVAIGTAVATGEQFPIDSGEGEFWLIVFAVIGAIAAVAVVVAAPVFLVIGVIYGTDALVKEAKPFDEQRTTIFSLETVRVPCESGALEWNSGAGRLDLGKQASGGWVIDAATLDRLNLSGATVLLRAGDLSATIVIRNR